MTRVWYDDDADVIWIDGMDEPFAPRTLRASAAGDMVAIGRPGESQSLVYAPFSRLADVTGEAFPSAAAAVSYLDALFRRRRVVERTVPFLQASPSAVWVVNHNLGQQPAIVSCSTMGGAEIIGDVLHISDNQLIISFASPQSGRVRCI